MSNQGDTNKQQREKRISWTQVQPKNLKTRTWAARVVTYLLYHKCNAKLMIVYTSLLTTYGTALRKIANIYFYCTVNLQDSAPSNNIIMKEGEIKHQKAQEKIPCSRWDSNSDNPLEFSIGCFTTELLEGAGSKFNYCTPAREDCVRYLFKISCPPHLTTDRPFVRCFKPPFQSEAKCKAIDMKMIFYSHTNITTFTREAFHLASFWKWEFLELGNELAIRVKKSEQFVSVSKF